MLQEDEEHWGSAEDWSSSLAQDVCEVGGGEEDGESAGWRPVGRWDLTSSSLLIPPDHAAAGRAHRASAPHQPGVWGADGPLLLGGAGRIPAEVWRAGGEGRRAGVAVGHLDPGASRERRDESESSQSGQGRLCGDHRLCWAECPARDPYPAALHLSTILPFSSHQLPAARRTIP